MATTTASQKTFSFGGCEYERLSPPRKNVTAATKVLNFELSLGEALKLSLALDEVCRKINRYKLSTTAGKRARVGVAVHLGPQRVITYEAKAPAK